jgi:hypothetical protein
LAGCASQTPAPLTQTRIELSPSQVELAKQSAVGNLMLLFYDEVKAFDASLLEQLPVLGRSTSQQVFAFLSRAQIKPEKILEGVSSTGRYRYIQAYYKDHFLVFLLGAQRQDAWHDRLYMVSLTVTRPGRVTEGETTIYRALAGRLGRPLSVHLYEYSQSEPSDLNVYVWSRPSYLASYRAPYIKHPLNGTSMVFEVWDRDYRLARGLGFDQWRPE